jgi:hypothetical protein
MKYFKSVFFLFGLLPITYISAEVIHVPADTSTIQGGIFLADEGDTVLVAEDTYFENINFNGKAIIVASQFFIDGDTSHISKTIIDGSEHTHPDSGSVVYFISGEDTNSVLYGFTITGGSGTRSTYDQFVERDGGGILIYYSGGKVEHNIVRHNMLHSALDNQFGAGICAAGDVGDYIVIRNNKFINNTIISSRGYAAGAGLTTKETLLFENNTIANNTIAATVIAWGGGILVDANFGFNGQIILNRNIIYQNETNCADYLEAWSGGIGVAICGPKMTNNIIYGNVSNGYGGGVSLRHNVDTGSLSRPVFINNTVFQNEARYGGGIYVRGSYMYPVVFNSIMWLNTALGGGHQFSGDTGNLTVAYSDIQGNWTGDGNIDGDPLFADSLAFTLSESSPCIGAGTDSLQVAQIWHYCPPSCIYGTSRPNPPGSAPDIGASEHILSTPSNIEELQSFEPQVFQLSQNYPNPFNPNTRISFTLPKQDFVTLEVYNTLGQNVATLLDTKMNTGSHDITFGAFTLPSGIYFYRIQAGEFSQVKKMVLLR